ncbi:MAG TPA: M14 family zinc carboxypeptidase, partial [Anaerovoracaceae bacterium]|nr:M14 family zinc carboxypeptidase [Anaerovoracaceae bacterium]
MKRQKCRALLSLAVIVVLVCSSFTVFAATTETEYPLPRNAILYSEIEGQLKALEAKNPNLMDYQVIGQSAGGKDLYLVTISDAAGMKNLTKYQKFMQDAVNNPESARKALKGSDIKIPVFFNASIHGNETTGTDGVLKLIDRLLTDNSSETNDILKNCLVLINVCQNPDGRISGHRENATGTDLNRDYITQSQPEVQAVVNNIASKWYPTAMLDLHGFMGNDNILLEPCTIPHNPNYEYDLAIKYALPHAEAIAAELTALTKRDIDIPYKVWEDGWDDYPPIFTPQYFMYLGGIGHTLEVKFPNQQGIDSAYTACVASLKYVSKNKIKMLDNQFAIFERGVKGLDVEKDVTFPQAYVIPMNASQQQDTLEAANMIKRLLTNKIIVKQADAAFTADGVEYPAGTYVVPMKQGLRGLVNTMLWKGEDISDQASAMYDISAYSFPELCGFDAPAISKSFTATLSNVAAAPVLKGTLESGTAKNYIMPVENNQAYKVANSLVKDGVQVYRTSEANGAYAPGSFVIPN